MKKKIGRWPGKKGLYPNVYSACINRSLARRRTHGNFNLPDDELLEYARKVEERYNRLYKFDALEIEGYNVPA